MKFTNYKQHSQFIVGIVNLNETIISYIY